MRRAKDGVLNMTTFEALVSMAKIVLRQRGQWQAGATAHDEIDLAVNQCSDLLPEGSRQLCEMAIAEIKRNGNHESIVKGNMN